jgi:hypothetical protein
MPVLLCDHSTYVLPVLPGIQALSRAAKPGMDSPTASHGCRGLFTTEPVALNAENKRCPAERANEKCICIDKDIKLK